jgi:D-xylose transport system substrate-binding protein
MLINHRRLLAIGLIAIITATTFATTGCNNDTHKNRGAGCTKIGVLLPDSTSSSRWENKDRPLLQQTITTALPGATINFSNANRSQNTQLSQAEMDLNSGDCILVVAAPDSATASSIVQEAHNKDVPVIAYDRLINDTSLDYYVSFDGIAVGVAQGSYIKEHYQQYVTGNGTNNIVLISGSETDNNALLFSKGVHQILDPIFSEKTLSNQGEVFTLQWDLSAAETEIDRFLTKLNNKVAIAYVANDAMASTVITALMRQNLNGKVMVTGQDASPAAINQILLGNQMMTVYKSSAKEAQATATLIAAISHGTGTKSLISATATYNNTNIPAILLPVEAIDKTNIAATVLADKYVTKSDICQNVPAGTAGIC